MSADIEKLAEKTDSLSISEPIFETNWNNLSEKLKLQCIEQMELKERLLLRCTSKSERTLVDSNKCHAIHAEFFIFPEQASVTINQENKTTTYFHFPRNADYKCIVPLIERLLQLVSFGELEIRSSERIDFTDELSGGGEYQVKCFSQGRCSKKDLMYWMNSLKTNGVEMVKLNADDDKEFPFEELLNIPSVINSPFWQVVDICRSDCCSKLAQIWLDKDAEIKTTFLIKAFVDGTMKDFRKTFADRIVHDSKDFIRIRTDNPAKQIALELGVNIEENDIDAIQFIRMMVIPSELQDKDYDRNTDGWMDHLDPELYFHGEKVFWDSDMDSDDDYTDWDY